MIIGHSVQPGAPQVQPVTARQENRFPHLGLETATYPSAYRLIPIQDLQPLQLRQEALPIYAMKSFGKTIPINGCQRF